VASTQLDLRSQQYGNNIMLLAQRKMSKMLPFVYNKGIVTGKTFFQDRMAEWSMEAKGGLNVATPQNDPGYSRRMAYIKTYNDGRLVDRSITLQSLANPTSEWAMNAAYAMGRKIDSEILTALIGSAAYGEAGGSSVALPSAQKIANGSTGLTLAKILQAKRIMDEDDVEEDGRCMVVSPQALEDMLSVEQLTSNDYNSVKALVRGDVDTFLGFKFIKHTGLAVASLVRSCIAFQRNALAFGSTAGSFVKVEDLPTRSYSKQIYYELNIGAVRLEEERVVQVDILEV